MQGKGQGLSMGRASGGSRPTTVLFLAANPAVLPQLSLDQEAREITSKIRASEHRDSLSLVTRWVVSPDDLIQHLNEHEPDVLHFSGHGEGADEIGSAGSERDSGLVFVGEVGEAKEVSVSALEKLFAALKRNIRLVVLNACYSEPQARAIAKHIDCVVGMSSKVGDDAAIVFAASFYRALGFGRSVKEAFDQGVVALAVQGETGSAEPQLICREGVDAGEVWLVGGEGASEASRDAHLELGIGGTTGGGPSALARGEGHEMSSTQSAKRLWFAMAGVVALVLAGIGIVAIMARDRRSVEPPQDMKLILTTQPVGMSLMELTAGTESPRAKQVLGLDVHRVLEGTSIYIIAQDGDGSVIVEPFEKFKNVGYRIDFSGTATVMALEFSKPLSEAQKADLIARFPTGAPEIDKAGQLRWYGKDEFTFEVSPIAGRGGEVPRPQGAKWLDQVRMALRDSGVKNVAGRSFHVDPE